MQSITVIKITKKHTIETFRWSSSHSQKAKGANDKSHIIITIETFRWLFL